MVETQYDLNGVVGEHVYGLDPAVGHVDATWTVSHDEAGRLVDLVGPAVGSDPGARSPRPVVSSQAPAPVHPYLGHRRPPALRRRNRSRPNRAESDGDGLAALYAIGHDTFDGDGGDGGLPGGNFGPGYGRRDQLDWNDLLPSRVLMGGCGAGASYSVGVPGWIVGGGLALAYGVNDGL